MRNKYLGVEQPSQKKEIIWNIINSTLAGALVFFGAFIDGNITRLEIISSIGVSAILSIKMFTEYWNSEKDQYTKMFKFL